MMVTCWINQAFNSFSVAKEVGKVASSDVVWRVQVLVVVFFLYGPYLEEPRPGFGGRTRFSWEAGGEVEAHKDCPIERMEESDTSNLNRCKT